MRRFQRSVLIFLLAWLPFQAAAGPLLAGCCVDRAAAAAATTAGAPCHDHAVMAPDAPPQDGQGGDHENPGHLCCPHFSAAPVHRLGLVPAPTRFDAPARQLSERSHFPEQPQRPPRA